MKLQKAHLIGLSLILLTILTALPKVKAETIELNAYPYFYDQNLNIYHATCGTGRPPTPLPSGQWYTNTNFDPDPSNYAVVGAYGYAFLRAYSYATFFPDMHGWSNAFFHQGRIPYANGIYEGRFKAQKYSYQTPFEVDGIKYPMDFAVPDNWRIEIRLKITKRYVNSINAFASVLLFAIFQYEFENGQLSQYDAPPFTNDHQSVHFDIFLTRARRTLGFYSEDSVGTEDWDWGDAYNGDLHVQYVAGKISTVGEWVTITLNWSYLLQRCKAMIQDAWVYRYGYCPVKSIILRWMGLSAEVIGSELEVQIDYVKCYWIDHA